MLFFALMKPANRENPSLWIRASRSFWEGTESVTARSCRRLVGLGIPERCNVHTRELTRRGILVVIPRLHAGLCAEHARTDAKLVPEGSAEVSGIAKAP